MLGSKRKKIGSWNSEQTGKEELEPRGRTSVFMNRDPLPSRSLMQLHTHTRARARALSLSRWQLNLMPETRRPFPFSFLFFSCLLWAALPARPDDVEEDYACLAGFKASVQDTQNALGSWGVAPHQGVAGQRRQPCNGSITSWAGVTCNDDRVVSLHLRASDLSGALSPDLWKCAALGALDVSANQITGEIPAALGRLANLVSLNLSANRLSGEIPVSLANCSYLKSLDLHGNALAGRIPDELGLLERLQVLDVSDNGLSGAIPGVLSYGMAGGPRFNASSFDGNKGLFGYPLSSSSSSSSSYSSFEGQGGGHTLSLLEIAGIGLASGVFSLTVSFTAVCIWLKMAEQRRAAEEGKICELELN